MMIPCPSPTELNGSSLCEEMLIAKAFLVMQVYKKPLYGTISYKAHVMTLPHNVQKRADILPNPLSEMPVVMFQARHRDNKKFNFKDCGNFVLKVLCWLRKHSL